MKIFATCNMHACMFTELACVCPTDMVDNTSAFPDSFKKGTENKTSTSTW